MSEDAFTWHPDQDDVYEGADYGSTTLDGLPYSAFDKDNGKSFTMNGDSDDTLTLSPIGVGETLWGRPGSGVTEINVNGGTLAFEPLQSDGLLTLGNPVDHHQISVNIRGTFLVRQTNVINELGNFPTATFNISASGRCSISGGERFAGSYVINVNESGSMSVSANEIELLDGTYLATGIADRDTPSLELIAVRSLTVPESGGFEIRQHEMTFKSASISRLRAASMSFADTHIRAEDSASLLIACDFIDVDSDTVFAVGQGSAVITFVGSEKNAAPFDFFNNAYPKGLFNFITTEGINKSAFRFLNVGNSAYDFKKMQTDGVITIDGAPDTQSKCDWRSEVDGADRYFVIFLK